MSLRTIIVDDEPLARSSLRVLLARDPAIELVAECGSGEEAVGRIRDLRPDLAFLDIQMPEVDGFDVLERLGACVPPAVVFVTAFDQHALRAFDAGALDYVLKPFSDARFDLALGRAKAQVAQARAARGAADVPDRIAVRSGRGIQFVLLADVAWVESADYCVDLHVADRTHTLRRSMASIEAELEPAGFCRIHRSAIVNLAHVRALEAGVDGEAEVVLRSGERLPTSRRHRATLQERLGRQGVLRA
jgi:two-component system LytT family response regulator